MSVIETRGLVAGPDGLPAVRGLDLHVEGGEIVALLGPNGAGKTVTLATLAGVWPPISGSAVVLGAEVAGHSVQSIARRGLAYLAADRGLFTQLRASQNLRLYRHRSSAVAIDDVLAYFPGLRDHLDTKVGLLSGGEQQMLALACQLVADPAVLLIDELSHGLAPLVVEDLLATLRRLASEVGIGVLLVEQSLPHALAVADRGYLLSNGQLMASGTAAELAASDDLMETAYLGARFVGE